MTKLYEADHASAYTRRQGTRSQSRSKGFATVVLVYLAKLLVSSISPPRIDTSIGVAVSSYIPNDTMVCIDHRLKDTITEQILYHVSYVYVHMYVSLGGTGMDL